MDKQNNFNILKPTKTTKFFDKMNELYYLTGSYGYWINEVKYSPRFVKMYDKFVFFILFLETCFHCSVFGAFFTQPNLNEEQKSVRLMFGVILPGSMMFYVFLLFYKKDVRHVLYTLMVHLKEHHNDPVLETEMIGKIRKFSISLELSCSLLVVCNGIKSFYQVITKGDNFVTVIGAWPDVNDNSLAAGVGRVVLFLCWWIYAIQITSTMSILVAMLIGICYQFKNLQSYFYSLNDIFTKKKLSHEEKETKYEEAFKLGIKMHTLTLRCAEKHKNVSKEILALTAVLFSSMLLSELINFLNIEHNVANIVAIMPVILATLLSLGFFMWNGGDITAEAFSVSTAMYSSGWENCYGTSSVRIRKLAVNAIGQAQKSVVYQALGVIDFSYSAYVSLVKAPYTVVSIFY